MNPIQKPSGGRIIHGDSIAVLRTYGDDSVDLI